MKIYINEDDFNRDAVKTKEAIIETSREFDIDITDDVEESDIVISVGGDGTFLETAGLAQQKPIIGINIGTLGYLTEVSPDNIEMALKNLLDGNYEIESRMMLEGEVIRTSGEVIRIPESLNEIAVSKNTLGVVRFDVMVNEKIINSYTADGILVCTPTGSTAYNLSCGGPIVDPGANIMTLTPIAPHSILNRSIILSDDSIVDIKITELRKNTTSHALYDGNAIEVFSGDIIRIKKSDKITKIVKIENRCFIDNIREKIN